MLKHTLFYSDWAEKADKCLYNEQMIASNPQFSYLRSVRLDEDFFYNINEMHKMLGKLVLHNRSNKMAFDYFMAELLLMGDFRSYVANLPEAKRMKQNPLPAGYEQYYQEMQKKAAEGVKTDVTTGASVLQN